MVQLAAEAQAEPTRTARFRRTRSGPTTPKIAWVFQRPSAEIIGSASGREIVSRESVLQRKRRAGSPRK